MIGNQRSGRFGGRRPLRMVGVIAVLAAAVGAGAGASASSTSPPDTATNADAPGCGTEPVELRAYFETGFDLPFKLSEEFTRQFPNVTWDISQDQFTNLMNATPRLLSGDNPPDLIRLPSMVSLVADGLLMNLDGYASAFGWDEWPAAQLAQNRVAEDGTRGSGSLYAMGLNYSLTGVFYNRELADQIGMTEPPATVAEFDDLLAAAKEAGLLPIMVWNASAERRRPGVSAPAADGRVRSPGADQRLDLPEARGHHQHPEQPRSRRTLAAVDRSRLLPRGRQCDPVHRRQRPVPRWRGSVHLQRRLGERRPTTARWRATSGSCCSHRSKRAHRSRRCRHR